jgi:hypothetical protein
MSRNRALVAKRGMATRGETERQHAPKSLTPMALVASATGTADSPRLRIRGTWSASGLAEASG